MIKNPHLTRAWFSRGLLEGLLVAAALGSATACSKSPASTPEPFQGVVEFDETVVAFELGGRVVSLGVDEGDRVKAGDLVATLDDDLDQRTLAAHAAEAETARAEVDRTKSGSRREDIAAMASRIEAAKAGEKLLSKNLARETQLMNQGVTPGAVVDDLDAQLARSTAERKSLEQNLLLLQHGAKREDIQLAQARAAASQSSLEIDKSRIDKHALRAPSPGLVVDKHVEVGEIVGQGTAVVTLADTQHPYVTVFVPEGDLGAIHLDGPARVRVDALDAPLVARVEHIARKTEFTPRFLFSERERPNLVVRVRVRIDDPKEKLHAGVPAFVTIEGARVR